MLSKSERTFLLTGLTASGIPPEAAYKARLLRRIDRRVSVALTDLRAVLGANLRPSLAVELRSLLDGSNEPDVPGSTPLGDPDLNEPLPEMDDL